MLLLRTDTCLLFDSEEVSGGHRYKGKAFCDCLSSLAGYNDKRKSVANQTNTVFLLWTRTSFGVNLSAQPLTVSSEGLSLVFVSVDSVLRRVNISLFSLGIFFYLLSRDRSFPLTVSEKIFEDLQRVDED